MTIAARSFASLLLLVFLAPSLEGQASASPKPAPQATADPAFAAELPFCLEEAAPSLSGSTEQGPPALPAETGPVNPRCGTCSLGGCAGAAFLSPCGDNLLQHCVNTGICLERGLYRCECRP